MSDTRPDTRTHGGQPAAQATPVTAVATTGPAAGQVARMGATGEELATTAETETAALAAQARAMVEARFVMARRFPRSWEDVRVRLLAACERPGFAGSRNPDEKIWGAGWYRKPVGDGAEGFSIRFAEEALRCMRNVSVETHTTFDNDRMRIVVVEVLDLESNLSFPTAITITKTVERRKLRRDEVALRIRTNAAGQPTYIVEATEDDVFQKQQNMVSKAIRNGALRLLPGDIQGECRTRLLAIRNGDAAKDPAGFLRKVVDGFAKLNVLPSHLEELVGHPLAQCTPHELTSLRELWTELHEGRTTWAEVMAEASDMREEAAGPDAQAAEGAPGPRPGLAGLTDRLRAQRSDAPAGQATDTPAAAAAAPSAAAAQPAGQPAAGQYQRKPADCSHERVPPSSLAPGASATCPDCGEVLTGEREPGADDGPPPAGGQASLPGTPPPAGRGRRGPLTEG